MQDVHWFGGQIGRRVFQGYALGNILSAQFYEEALKARAEIPLEIIRGTFDALQRMAQGEHLPAREKFTAPELIGEGYRKGNGYRTLYPIPLDQVRRAVSAPLNIGIGSMIILLPAVFCRFFCFRIFP